MTMWTLLTLKTGARVGGMAKVMEIESVPMVRLQVLVSKQAEHKELFIPIEAVLCMYSTTEQEARTHNNEYYFLWAPLIGGDVTHINLAAKENLLVSQQTTQSSNPVTGLVS